MPGYATCADAPNNWCGYCIWGTDPMCIPIDNESSRDAQPYGRNSTQNRNLSAGLPYGLPCDDFTPYGDPEELGLTMVDGRWYYSDVAVELLKC